MALNLSNLSGNIANSANFFIYALRRDDDDMLILQKVSTASTESVDFRRNDGTQMPGITEGIDYVEETTPERAVLNHPQDKYQQIRFDSRNINYFFNTDGDMIVQYNGTYDYETEGPK